MTTGLTDFQKKLAEWERKFGQTAARTQSLQERVEELSQVSQAKQLPQDDFTKWLQQNQPGIYSGLQAVKYAPPNAPGNIAVDIIRGLRARPATNEYVLAQRELSRNIFYGDLYGTVPALVAARAVNSVDEALNMIAVPEDLTQEELAQIRNEVNDLLSARDVGQLPVGDMPELEPEETALIAPTAVAPPQRPAPPSLQRLTVNEIVRTLQATAAPKTPTSTMSQTEWDEYLKSKGWSEEDVDEQVRVLTEQLVADAQNRKNLVEAYRNEVAYMPEQTTLDILKQAVVNPPLVVLEGLNIYYEHVSMPAAGWLYGQIPDIEAAYNQFKTENPNATEREARVYAWKQWEAPGPPVADFVLKYMLMEGVVDPLSYVGWGFVTKGLRALGPAGRLAAAGNVAAGQVMELPFDGIKWFAKSVIPKTISQQAAVMSRNSLSILDRYFELATRKPLTFILPKDMYKAGEEALEHLARNPRAEDNIAMAARELLAHPPVSRREATSWTERLRRTGTSTFGPDELTDQTLFDLNDIFEKTMNKEITVDEAAPFILQKLGASSITEEGSVLAGRILADRANTIFSRALDFANRNTANQAMQTYARKSLKIYEAVVTSTVLKESYKAGRFQMLFYEVDKGVVGTWVRAVDKLVIRHFAEAYLTFGMYGPMNVMEDIWRSILGGVKPGRVSVERYDIITQGLLGDPELRRSGLSEMIGPLRETGDPARANWVLTLGLSPLSVPTWAATRGRVTPKDFSKGVYKTMVELFGGIGADMRRNFVTGRYLQILGDIGGNSFKLLDDAVQKLPSELNNAPKWVRRNLEKDLHAAAVTGKLDSTASDMIEALKNRYTRERVHRAEVNDILMKYSDISPTARSMIMDGFDEKRLLRSADDIDNFMGEVYNAEVDDFLRGPERATAQYDQLTELLTSLEVRNPEDMADLIVALHRMTSTYGALPEQILARATIKSRGLPVNDRRLHFDTEADRIQTFLEKAGADIDKVVERLRAPEIAEKLPRGYQDAAQRYYDLVTTARQTVAAAKSRDLAFRQSYFADATQKDLRDPRFWDSFYASEMSHWKNVNKQLATINSQLHRAIDDINRSAGHKMPVRKPVKVVGRELAPADVAKLMQTRGDDLSKMLLDTLIPEGDKDYFVEYVMGMVKQGDEGFTRESVDAVYDQIAASIQVDPTSSSWFRVRQKQLESMTVDFHDLYQAKLFPKEMKVAVDDYIDRTVSNLDQAKYEFGGERGVQVLKPEFENYDNIRQQALDEANKWYYKEYTDYTNANALDAAMKQLYPFWTYESQRWFWLPRSFVRRPATLTAWGRWENNTDYGYFHIPGTSIDINPARGTVYGPWSTRLMRRDYPEYYDELEGMGGMVEFFDFVSRYGFYPNVIYGATLAQAGGATGQLGGILPSMYSTPLNAMIATFPDNELVKFISDKVFAEPFRHYLTSRRVDDLGGDGSLIFAKIKSGQELTDEEQAMWTEARGDVARHSALFEQLGFARMKSDEAYELYKASEAFIEEQWGYTPEQQRELRMKGEKIWDLIGGLDPWETAMLQELEFFKYSGSVNPVLPSHKQEILNKIEIDWADVANYSDNMRAEVLELQQDFLTGSARGRLGPDEFLGRVRELYRQRRDYIDTKTKANPLMLLENRTAFYDKYGDTMPVVSPYNELMNMFFSIELEETVDPATGARVYDWDKFWANREHISDAIPEADKGQWEAFLSRNTAPMMKVWNEVYNTYFRKYYNLYDQVLSTYSPEEQALINEYLFLERTGQQLERQVLIKETTSAKTGHKLISGFRSEISAERQALRYANPTLDAWLYYWGRVSTFVSPTGEQVYRQLAAKTGRRIE